MMALYFYDKTSLEIQRKEGERVEYFGLEKKPQMWGALSSVLLNVRDQGDKKLKSNQG